MIYQSFGVADTDRKEALADKKREGRSQSKIS